MCIILSRTAGYPSSKDLISAHFPRSQGTRRDAKCETLQCSRHVRSLLAVCPATLTHGTPCQTKLRACERVQPFFVFLFSLFFFPGNTELRVSTRPASTSFSPCRLECPSSTEKRCPRNWERLDCAGIDEISNKRAENGTFRKT